MILKIYNKNPEHYSCSGWVFYDRIDHIQSWDVEGATPNTPQPPLESIFTDLGKPHRIARVWRMWQEQNDQRMMCFDIAFSEAYLLGDDGKTIERL